jgi:trans-aconitate methyltransferase
VERIPAETWYAHRGHVARYIYAGARVRAGEHVNDIACGVGYGALCFPDSVTYDGYDKPGVASETAFGSPRRRFFGVDLDDPSWRPDRPADLTVALEALEHLMDPARVASTILSSTRRAVIISVPIVPTRHENPWHRHDFELGDIPTLFAPFAVAESWGQPEERSHVWLLQAPRAVALT